MKPSQKSKRETKRQRDLAALQVQEYVDRYRPDLGKAGIDVSRCGRFASVTKPSAAPSSSKKGKI
jgi:hypothetical protein